MITQLKEASALPVATIPSQVVSGTHFPGGMYLRSSTF
jgi:hypothetical protein